MARGLLVALLCITGTFAVGVRAEADDGTHIVISDLDVSAYPDVQLVAAVVDASGKPVRGLGASDLKVTENGVPQDATVRLRSEVAPLALAVLLDTSGSMGGRPLADAKAAIASLLSALGPNDQGSVITFNAAPQVRQTLTSDRGKLLAATNAAAAGGDTAIYDALATASTTLQAAPSSARPVIVLLTDGIDTASRGDRSAVLTGIAQQHVPVVVIGLGTDLDRVALREIAAAAPTGRFVEAPKPADLAAIYDDLAVQLLSQYSVAYRTSASAADDANMTVGLSLQRNGQVIVAGITYHVPPGRGVQAPPVATPPPAEEPAPAPAVVVTPRTRMPELIGLLGAATVLTLLLWISELANAYPGRQRRRLEMFVRSLSLTQAGHAKRRSIVQRIVVPTLRAAGRPLLRITPRGVLTSTRARLQQAGEPMGLGAAEFIGVRAGLAVALGVIALGVGTRMVDDAGALALYMLGGGLLGFALPGFVIDALGRNRKNAIRRALPAALDMLALSAEAGLSFDGAISQVAHRWDTPLSEEFRRLLVEFQMGRERRQALRELADRSGVPGLSRFSNAVIQADSLGVPLSRVLHEQSAQIRTQRRQHAEERARKAPVMMLFPMVALIFPALFVVILGPAVPRLLQSLGSLP
ncbi:MAG TPA: VWA domain-containing protein [Candidatus Acidoferrales bacterium]|nr:VWA domain-containing protein [Candidatus Acidoferrales bacterium]